MTRDIEIFLPIVCVIAIIFFLVPLIIVYLKTNNEKKYLNKQSKIDKKYLELDNVVYLKEQEILKINYFAVHMYNKVEKYVQRNYQKYPIYTKPIEDKKTLSKEIYYNKYNVNDFSKFNIFDFELTIQIIDSVIDSIPFIPEWYMSNLVTTSNTKTDELKQSIKTINKEIKESNIKMENQKKLILELSEVYQETPNWKFIKKEHYRLKIIQITKNIAKLQDSINLNMNKVQEYQTSMQAITDNLNKCIEKNEKYFNVGLDKLEEGFSFLEDFFINNTLEFKGCYVIKNIENQKVYVGQSKNVIRRVKQHFDYLTLKPKNAIFMEDYYTSNISDKKRLFIVKSIACETKDELDDTEKKLIAMYDSYNKGYNQTKGNT